MSNAPLPPPPPPMYAPASASPAAATLTAPALGETVTMKSMPPELREHLVELEQWTIGNQKDARSDAVAFWMFKVPAIVASAGAGVLAHFQLTTVSLIAGAIASLAVINDGVHPRECFETFIIAPITTSESFPAIWSRNGARGSLQKAMQT
jgi:hypothetical protein